MLQVAAMTIGLLALWLLWTQRWAGPLDLAAAAVAALICTLCAARFGGVRGNGFAKAPGLVALAVARAPAIAAGVLATLRAALAADIALKPALVRVKTRAAGGEAAALFAAAISAAPGAAVVSADDDGLLAHVIDEDAVDPAALGQLEAQILAVTHRGAQR